MPGCLLALAPRAAKRQHPQAATRAAQIFGLRADWSWVAFPHATGGLAQLRFRAITNTRRAQRYSWTHGWLTLSSSGDRLTDCWGAAVDVSTFTQTNCKHSLRHAKQSIARPTKLLFMSILVSGWEFVENSSLVAVLAKFTPLPYSTMSWWFLFFLFWRWTSRCALVTKFHVWEFYFSLPH